jgi:hypothetical protein
MAAIIPTKQNTAVATGFFFWLMEFLEIVRHCRLAQRSNSAAVGRVSAPPLGD